MEKWREELYHYGIRGMKWKKRREHRQKVKEYERNLTRAEEKVPEHARKSINTISNINDRLGPKTREYYKPKNKRNRKKARRGAEKAVNDTIRVMKKTKKELRKGARRDRWSRARSTKDL